MSTVIYLSIITVINYIHNVSESGSVFMWVPNNSKKHETIVITHIILNCAGETKILETLNLIKAEPKN